jgi:hypothetical protein
MNYNSLLSTAVLSTAGVSLEAIGHFEQARHMLFCSREF